MPVKSYRPQPDIGFVIDEENKTFTLFAGNSVIELNGKTGQVVLSGKVTEMSGGSRKEEGLLQRNTGITSIIPSTMATPIPQTFFDLPIGEITDMVSDITKMVQFLG